MQPQDPTSNNQNIPPTPPEQQRDGGQPQPQQMYYTRPLDPKGPAISEEIRTKHEASKQAYPALNLSAGEYIISDVKRHPIGLIQIWGLVVIVLGVLAGVVAAVLSGTAGMQADTSLTIPLVVGAGLVACLTLLGGYIGTYVYRANRFYLTNESVIQNIQTTLFSHREQTVSLGNIEDASFTKRGILQYILDYGSIRLSTEGDETTYRFYFAARPQQQVAILNNAVEAFKNGRPVGG